MQNGRKISGCLGTKVEGGWGRKGWKERTTQSYEEIWGVINVIVILIFGIYKCQNSSDFTL